MKVLTTITIYLLLALGVISFAMGIIGMSLTPLVLGGVLVGLGVLIFQQQRQNQTIRELAEAIRYNAYTQSQAQKEQQKEVPHEVRHLPGVRS